MLDHGQLVKSWTISDRQSAAFWLLATLQRMLGYMDTGLIQDNIFAKCSYSG